MPPQFQPCAFAGNADLYGIGIRIGLYLQWISTLAASVFTPHDEGVVRILNLLIQSAMLLGMVLLTRDSKMRPVEPVITIWLLFGALSSLSGSGVNPVGRFSGIFRLVIYSTVAGYACWFWFVGLDGLLEQEPPHCTVVAFFGRVSIDGPFRTFNQVASILGGMVCVFFILWTVIFIVRRVMSRGSTTGHRALRKRTARVELLILSSVIIILSIVRSGIFDRGEPHYRHWQHFFRWSAAYLALCHPWLDSGHVWRRKKQGIFKTQVLGAFWPAFELHELA